MKVDLILLITYSFTLTMVKAGIYSDIFPKSITKFVITSRPYAQVRIYTPRPTLMPKNPFLSSSYQPVYHHTTSQDSEELSVTRHPLFQVTKIPLEEQIRKQIIYKAVNDNDVLYPTVEHNGKDLNIEDSEEFSTDVSEIDEIEFQNDNDVFDRSDLISNTPDLDNKRLKRLSVKGSNSFNHWSPNIKANIASDASYEQSDKNEFIFIKDHEKKYSNDLLHNNKLPVMLDDDGDSTEVIMKEDTEARLKRSDNVIQEENIASTISGFKYTGRNLRINEHLIFKNINV